MVVAPQPPPGSDGATTTLTEGEDLRLQCKAISGMPPEERRIVKQLLEGMIIKYEAER